MHSYITFWWWSYNPQCLSFSLIHTWRSWWKAAAQCRTYCAGISTVAGCALGTCRRTRSPANTRSAAVTTSTNGRRRVCQPGRSSVAAESAAKPPTSYVHSLLVSQHRNHRHNIIIVYCSFTQSVELAAKPSHTIPDSRVWKRAVYPGFRISRVAFPSHFSSKLASASHLPGKILAIVTYVQVGMMNITDVD